MVRLSKSRFISGWQCPLKLWNDVNHRDLLPPVDEALQAVFDTGHEVGELAQQRWPGGVLVDGPHWAVDEAVEQTRQLLEDPDVPAIYEAAIMHQGALTRVDILARLPDGGWDLVEVKSSTRVKQPFDTDVAMQYWVLRGAGLDVRRAGVLVLNRSYVYPGGEHDLVQLFRFEDLTAQCEQRRPDIGHQIIALQDVLQADAPPEIEPGDHCFSPYECPWWSRCTRDQVFPERPIDLLPRLGVKREQLQAMGVDSVDDIPADFPLNEIQARVRDCILTGEPWISPRLGEQLEDLTWPLHFLDFEAVGLAIPRFQGTRPYDQMPFQFSCHHQAQPGAKLTHSEFLATDGDDPREPIALALLEALGEEGTIVVYSSYESRTIGSLANDLPQLAPKLRALQSRLFDLLVVIRQHYYHPAFNGSFSIKAVLPVLVPGMDYADMAIADGMAASRAWPKIVQSTDPAERERLETALRDYCRQDSLAMARLREALLESALVAGQSPGSGKPGNP